MDCSLRLVWIVDGIVMKWRTVAIVVLLSCLLAGWCTPAVCSDWHLVHLTLVCLTQWCVQPAYVSTQLHWTLSECVSRELLSATLCASGQCRFCVTDIYCHCCQLSSLGVHQLCFSSEYPVKRMCMSPSLHKSEWWVLVWLFVWRQVQMIAYCVLPYHRILLY